MHHCLKPLRIKSLHMNNRLVLPPMASGMCSNEGSVTEEVLKYYQEKSQGGCLGTIIVEHCFISPEGKAHNNQMSIASDDTVEGLTQLTQRIHDNGSIAVAQISHAGGATSSEITGYPSVAPSDIPASPKGKVEHLLTREDIPVLANKFAAAAIRAKTAGFDGVEIHAAHKYLLNQFYSPLTNHRTDEYGGSVSGRCRALVEVVRSVRIAVGPDYPIFLRLGACDYQDGGNSIPEAVEAAKLLEQAGVDVLDISGGMCGYMRKNMTDVPGYFQDVSQAIRQAVSIPVILTGGITRIEDAEALLKDGKADLIGIGRAMFKDSTWARKSLMSLAAKSADFRKNLQIGIVVQDLDTAAAYWQALTGIQPVFGITENYEITGAFYRGNPCKGIVRQAFFDLENVQIELISPIDSEPSFWAEGLAEQGSRLHHIAFRTSDIRNTLQTFAASGITTLQFGTWPMAEDNGAYAYLDTQKLLGTAIELLDF